MKKVLEFHHGALADSYEKQANEQGYTYGKNAKTREEAISIMKVIVHMLEEKYDTDRVEEAVDMAISALSEKDWKFYYDHGYAQAKRDLSENKGDLISREAVLKIIDGWYEQNRDTDNIEDLIVLITYMDSVNPQKPICPSAGVDCEDCPAYEDAISRKAVLDTEYQTIDINGVEYVMLSEVQMKMRKLSPVVTKEERALLQRWRDNRGVSMEEFAKALELLKEDKA